MIRDSALFQQVANRSFSHMDVPCPSGKIHRICKKLTALQSLASLADQVKEQRFSAPVQLFCGSVSNYGFDFVLNTDFVYGCTVYAPYRA
ncbi:hypothetical protein P1P91_11450 [Halomonas piscis]|uniref:Uncharacterized protein n=1 Tax=Halomonas piscis TaxID=3031727 RepID=A0ABY9YZG8_9GAMM|nr:hypothetical protein [Halomonas piscis]WNK19459.1 hypothetical protein P1P91_11450 [Halomonas piscis]